MKKRVCCVYKVIVFVYGSGGCFVGVVEWGIVLIYMCLREFWYKCIVVIVIVWGFYYLEVELI